jgi:hypothetical protein
MVQIMAMYVAYLGMGHTLMFKTIKARTVRIYLSEAAKLIQKRREAHVMAHPQAGLTWFCPTRTHGATTFAPPIASVLKEIERWENMIDRREPLTVDMIHFQKTLCRDSTPHSLDQAMYDWETTGIYAGFRLSEWAQEDHVQRLDQVKLTIDGEPTAFLIDDLEYKGENGRFMTRQAALQRSYLVQQVLVRWRFQKNGTKKEQKTFVRISGGDRSLCAVSAWLRILKRWTDFSLGPNFPLAVFSDTGLSSGKPVLICSTHIKASLQHAATEVYGITDPAALSRFSAHSIRVGACVALHAAGIQQQDIKFALRWKSDSFYNYLRNLPCQSARMASAVINFNPNCFTLVPSPVD